jgi:hypothetical protein
MKQDFKCPACGELLSIDIEELSDENPLICLECGTGIDIKKDNKGKLYLEVEV